jgi:Rrf2 family nitric oxide-sensitive transcriptional repressor
VSAVRFSLQTDYALRTLMYLATRRERATIDNVATLFGISKTHVAKVVNQLARLGYLRSVRGIGGGIELCRDPAEVTIGEVVLSFEGSLNLLDCVTLENVCSIERFCKLKGVLAEAERRQVEYLSSICLADVLPTRRQLATIEPS